MAEVLYIIFFFVVFIMGFAAFFGAPYVPTLRRDIDRAFKELYVLSDTDMLVDLGSGDGVILRKAAKHKARSLGYEINPVLVLISRLLGRTPLITVKLSSFWHESFPDDTTIVYAFSVSRDIKKLEEKLQAEADRMGHDFKMLIYGSELHNFTLLKATGAHRLYVIQPLHKQ